MLRNFKIKNPFQGVWQRINSVAKLYIRYVIIACAWFSGLLGFMLFISFLMSVGSFTYRDSVFSARPLWIVSRYNSKDGKNIDATQDKDVRIKAISSLSASMIDKRIPQIAIVRINGTIMPNCYSHGSVCPQVVSDFLDYVKETKKIKGVVVLLNSPGGEVYASDTIYRGFKELSSVKPVYVYIQSEGASGAYYLSLGANKIYGSPVSIVGSIGVYMEVFNYDGLLNKLGIQHRYIVSSHAKYKLAGNLIFNNTKDSKFVQNQLQDIIDATEKVFWERVRENRPDVPLTELQGLVFSANKAKQLHLIDGIVDSPKNVVIDLLKENNIQDKKISVEEYSISRNSNIYGLASGFNQISRILLGESHYYLMWK